MCGIAGYWSSQGNSDASVAERMMLRIQHRGPDDGGIWLDEEVGLALAHRRLAVIDLSAAGHQPMISPCGRYVLIFNGEIYNHLELRAQLEEEGGSFDWCGHSDTETLLAALRHWGIEPTLKRLNGMFAFALWDRSTRELYLARDRMGEKPLYFGRHGEIFLFGSELKALTAHPRWHGEVDRDSLSLYVRYNYVPAPRSIYLGIAKLLPAHYVVVREQGTVISEPRCYWNLGNVAERGLREQSVDETALTEELDVLLKDAVRRRMAADVPLGVFLSGGYDSTTVAALMQTQSARPVKTFTIGFHEPTYNEARHAKAIADHLGTDHTELYVTPDEAIDVIPKLPIIWDEPFSDSSQIPTYLVSQLARRHVTVSLSGDGGDELFFGYGRYFKGLQFEHLMNTLPGSVQFSAAAALRRVPVAPLDWLGSRLPGPLRMPALGDRLRKLGNILGTQDPGEGYKRLVSHWQCPETVVRGGREPQTILDIPQSMPNLTGLSERMMYWDSVTYLPDDILTKVDRASMAVCLEARVPLLDHRVVEFAWRVPMTMKYRDGKGKWLLREVLYRYVPRAMMDRPKMGFGVPIEHWLRGPLRAWGEELLAEKRLREEGFFDPVPIRKMWTEHVLGKRRWHYYLWDILMFQSWLDAHD